MSGDQHAGLNHNLKIDNKPFEKVQQFKYLVTTLTHKNSIHEEIKSRLRLGNAYCHSIQPRSVCQYAIQNYKIQDIQA